MSIQWRSFWPTATPGSGLDQLTGDITAGPGSGSQAATISNNSVTYAKMQDVSAASRLLGRGDSGAGDPQEITLGAGLTMTGTTLSSSGGGAADAGTLTGATLAANVVTSSLTSVGTLTSLAATGAITDTQNALGAATANGLVLQNTTAAAAGAQQWSPSVRWTGQGWGTTAPGSQSVDFQAFAKPIQGASAPGATWTLQASINGGAWSDAVTVSSGLALSVPGGSITAGTSVNAGITSGVGVTGRSLLRASADGVFQAGNNANTAFTSLSLGPDVATPSNVSLLAGSGVGADKVGGNLNIQAGLSTGAGVGGVITFKTSPSTGSSSTANTATTALTIDQNGLSTFAFPLRLKNYTVATLPTAGTAGRMAYVTDSLTPTFLTAVVGGGAVISPVFDNGTAWVTA